MRDNGARLRYGAARLVWDNRGAMDERELQARRPDASADALATVEEPALAEALGSADAPGGQPARRPSPAEGEPSPRPSPIGRGGDDAGAEGFGAGEELTLEDLLDMYATMLLVRTLDERVWAMNRQGKAAIVASCQGHEAAQLASVWALRKNAPDFFCFPYYRDLALTTALGLTPLESLLGFLAKAGEPLSGARQFPQHGAAPELRFINHSNVIGTHAPHAVGWALGVKMRGEGTVVGCFFGDGTTSQGDVHEAMNFASIHKLPIVFFVENNKYAISVPVSRQMAVERYAVRATGYAMPGVTVDGTDVRAAYLAASDAVRLAAMGGGPSVVEFDVERYLPHTSDDDDSVYRDRAEIEEARKRDPLAKLQGLLTAAGALTEERDAEMRRAARAEVDAATDAAEAAPFPDAGDFLRHVTAEAR